MCQGETQLRTQIRTQQLDSMAPKTSKNLLSVVVDPDDPNLDIVAVHGLNPTNKEEQAYTTWTADGKLWLRDFLPRRLPRARILIFGYNSNVAFETSTAGVIEQAENLLNRLKSRRANAPNRPLIFICHSLGGIVAKRALVHSRLDSTYKSISNSTYGIAFFGTPHQGGNHTEVGDIAAKILRGVLRNPSNSFMSTLQKGSVFAEAMRDFRFLAEEYQFISFYENAPLKPLGMIVDKKSATLGYSGTREKQIPLDLDHRGICRFASIRDDNYVLVEDNIVEFAQNAVLNRQPSVSTSESNFEDSLYRDPGLGLHFAKERRLETLRWLSRVHYAKNHKLVSAERLEGTGKWLLDHPLMDQWRDAARSSLFWLRGIPGAGKTYLASLVINELSKTAKKYPSKALHYHYCKADEEEACNSSSIFRAFLHQILAMLPLKPNAIEDHYEKQKLSGFSNGPMDFEDSFQLYLSVASNYSTISIVIDALDEFHMQSRRELLSGLTRLLLHPDHRFKIFVTSRSADDISFALSRYPNLDIKMSYNQADMAAFVKNELNQRVQDGRILRGDLPLSVRQRVETTLTQGAQGMFLWARLQLDHLCPSSTVSELLYALSELPESLKDTYRQIMESIQTQTRLKQMLAENTLRFLAYSSEPVKALSLARAVARTDGPSRVDPMEVNIDLIIDACQNLVALDSELGVLRLIHLTAREFLQARYDLNSSHAWIASQCLREFLDTSDLLEIQSLQGGDGTILPDFKLYSAIHWPAHSKLGSRTDEYIALEKDFVVNRTAHKVWIKLLKSLGSHTISNLETLLGLQRSFPKPSDAVFLSACFFGLRPMVNHLLSDPTITRNQKHTTISREEALRCISWLTPYSAGSSEFGDEFDHMLSDCFAAGMICAAEQGHVDLIRQLDFALQLPPREATKDAPKPILFTLNCCFYLGIAGGYLDVVKYISDRIITIPDGAWAHMPCGHIKGGTIAIAAFLGFPEIIEFFDKGIPWGEDTIAKRPKRLIQELFTVASRGNTRAAELIMEHTDVNINGKAGYGEPLLTELVGSAGAYTTEVFLKRPEIEVNIMNSFGETALMIAAHEDNAHAAEALCKHRDIDIYLRNNLGHTAFDIAVLEGSVEVVKVMLKHTDIDINKPMRNMQWSETPLIAAVRTRNFDVVLILLADKRVNLWARDASGLTALDIATRLDHAPLIRILDGLGMVGGESGEQRSLDDEYNEARSLIMYLRI